MATSSTSARCSPRRTRIRRRRTRGSGSRMKSRPVTRSRISRTCSRDSSRGSTRTSTRPTSSRTTISASHSRRWGCSTKRSPSCRRRCGRQTANSGRRRCSGSASSKRRRTALRSRSCGAGSIFRRRAIRSGWAFSTGSAAPSSSRARRPMRVISTDACSRSTSASSMPSSASKPSPRRNSVSQQVARVSLPDVQRPLPGKLEQVVAELIHLATLVHDDSVDHSVLRRGLPTINALFSHQIAVIMGVYLYSRAIIELVRLEDLEALRVLARVTNEMTVGEMRQLEAHDKLAYGEAEYDALIRAKTASLLSGACEVGALTVPANYRQALARFGMLLGMAFQITDDLLDYTEPEAVTGKPSGLDLREHKVTLPLIAALARVGPEGRRVVVALMEAAEPTDDLVAEVIRLVETAGGLETARQRALDLAQRAEAELDVLPPSPARDALQGSIAYAVERRS